MLNRNIAGGWPGWIWHRVVQSYWSLAVLAVIGSIPITLAVLYLDRHGGAEWLLDNGLATAASADTAKDFLGVATGVNAAFISLYFSITLIVLSMAASNLGVRLIDRWLERRLTRTSLAGLSFTLIASLIAMLSVDAEMEYAEVPFLIVGYVAVLQAINLAMLAVALHDLGRTMFVDRSVDNLGVDAASRTIDLASIPARDTQWRQTLPAPREGYIEGVDTDLLVKRFAGRNMRVRVEAAPGQHVMKGDPLLYADAPFDEDELKRAIPIGPFRSDSQGLVFQVRLLVEISARALSPAVNDFYTALTCADKLAKVMRSQVSTWVSAGCTPCLGEEDWLELPGQDFRSIFEDPLSAFRQAAADYPSVSIHMIRNYGRVAAWHRDTAQDPDGEFGDFMRTLASDLRDHATIQATLDKDRADIAKAFAASFGESAGSKETR